jgi:hypothetical protein
MISNIILLNFFNNTLNGTGGGQSNNNQSVNGVYDPVTGTIK